MIGLKGSTSKTPRLFLENHQAKFLWNGARRGEKSKHFINVNNLAIKTYCHSCSLNKNITMSNRLWQETGEKYMKSAKHRNLKSTRQDGSFMNRLGKCKQTF